MAPYFTICVKRTRFSYAVIHQGALSMSLALTELSKFKSWYRKNDIAITPWLFLLPAILFFATYVIFPIGQSFWISFHMWDGLGEKTFIGLDNYERLLGLGDQKMDRKFETSFWNNIKWLLLYLLARFSERRTFTRSYGILLLLLYVSYLWHLSATIVPN